MSDIPNVVSETYLKKLLCSGEMVKIRPAMVKEERIWLVGKDSENPKDLVEALATVTQNCIVDPPNFKVLNMGYNDFIWLFLEIMKVSKGDTIHLEVECPDEQCGFVEKRMPFKISEITTIKNLGINKSNIVKLSDDQGVEVKYPTLSYMLSLDQKSESTIKKNRKLQEYDLIQNHILAYLDKDSRYPFKNTEQAIEWTSNNLTSKNIEKIKEWFMNEPTPVFNIKWECSKCKRENKIEDFQLLRFLGL